MKRVLLPVWIFFILVSCTSTRIFPATRVPETAATVATAILIPGTLTQNGDSAPGELALSHVRSMSNQIGPRPAGTWEEAQTAQYIVTTLERLGYRPEIQPFTVREKDRAIDSQNLIALKQGLSPHEIIVGGHYDSVAAGKGADDNASGVGVMLEVAKRIKDVPTPYTIRFVFFGAEEIGLEGSKYYASQMMEQEIQKTLAMINLDSLIAGDVAYVYGDAGSQGAIRDWALQFAKAKDLDLQTQPGTKPEYPPGTTGDWSDHAPFKTLGIPYAYFESTNWMLGDQDGFIQVSPEYGENGKIWHTRYDTLEYIDTTFPGRIREKLSLFVIVLEGILTEYQAP